MLDQLLKGKLEEGLVILRHVEAGAKSLGIHSVGDYEIAYAVVRTQDEAGLRRAVVLLSLGEEERKRAFVELTPGIWSRDVCMETQP